MLRGVRDLPAAGADVVIRDFLQLRPIAFRADLDSVVRDRFAEAKIGLLEGHRNFQADVAAASLAGPGVRYVSRRLVAVHPE